MLHRLLVLTKTVHSNLTGSKQSLQLLNTPVHDLSSKSTNTILSPNNSLALLQNVGYPPLATPTVTAITDQICLVISNLLGNIVGNPISSDVFDSSTRQKINDLCTQLSTLILQTSASGSPDPHSS